MKYLLLFLPLLLATSMFAQKETLLPPVISPNGLIKVRVGLTESGEPFYSATFKGKAVIGKSKLGFVMQDLNLQDKFRVKEQQTSKFDETWKPVWGEVAQIRNHYNELTVVLQSSVDKTLTLVFRVFDDGIGFRYKFPESAGPDMSLLVKEELTEFQMTGDHTTWWIPGDYDSNEYLYTTSKISTIDATSYLKAETAIATMHVVDMKNVATPITFKTAEGVHLAIHEAALVNFPALQLHVDNRSRKFTANLVPAPTPPVKATIPGNFETPWRVVLISTNAAGLLNSKLILNLNEPNKIEDVNWIKPTKYVGIWWEMQIGKAAWSYADSVGVKPHGRHGATTENARKYIDFAAANGFNGVLIEGWDTGWEDWFGKWKEDVFDFQTPYPDYDLPALAKYSLEKGAPIIVHHETSGAATSFEKYSTKAYQLMNRLGLSATKTGYVGKIIPRGEWHDGQWMVNHYNRVLEKAATFKIMVDAHEPVRPTGLHRTYPNFMACEAARGNEFNAFSRGNPPEHETILPFTRLLGGPMDYTPGIFDIKFAKYSRDGHQVHTTIAKQLALYVTMYSPLQMAADLPENYANQPAFQFIRDVAVDWDDSRVLNAEVGDYLTVARKAKGTPNWFIGSITDEKARTLTIKFDFLDKNKQYEATIYEDGKDADWEKNPTAVNVRKVTVTKASVLKLALAPGGGCAISVMRK